MTRNTPPSLERKAAPTFPAGSPLAQAIPRDRDDVTIDVDRKRVALTNLRKPFFPAVGATKGDLLRYYADVAPLLVPHLAHRAMVMKRWPGGVEGEPFYMKRTPAYAPEWLERCSIEHGSGNVIAFPMVNDAAALLWVVNLGCIDLNEWYARCDDVDRPDYLHFDLDPVEGTPFSTVWRVALHVRDALVDLGMTPYAKTSGASGIHVYVAIERGPLQKEVWTFAKALAQTLERLEPDVVTAEYRIAKRPAGRVLVDYNQNAWGKTLASVYSCRATAVASVSTPVTWDEVAGGIEIEDFRLDNVRARLAERGDLWAPMAAQRGRFDLRRLIGEPPPVRRRARAAAPGAAAPAPSARRS